ncbi:hypothetical protein JIN84_09610 [Luteolibacter yonseiensis]|uniref:Uncharacterized protein n=1 Tax=Luteolibacter yonseiensis TaxID=1144680 RepID=A0A934VBX0_9BACT|nr:hypothetical protein [Luteolibacter yonseiensis]MBK1815874.1 hypothetical protein [Luteolibacter yonseiensis]
MNALDLEFGDFSDHPPPPQVTLDIYEKWVFEFLASGMRRPMTDEELLADFMRNEGRQTEEWPDFGAH